MNTIDTDAGHFEVAGPAFADEPAPAIKVPAGASLIYSRTYYLHGVEVQGEGSPGVLHVRGRVMRADGRPARVGTRADVIYVNQIEEC